MTFDNTSKKIVDLYQNYSQRIVENTWASKISVMEMGITFTVDLPNKIKETIDDWKFKVMLNGKPSFCNEGLTWNDLSMVSRSDRRFYASNVSKPQLNFIDNNSHLKEVQILGFKFQETETETKPVTFKDLQEMKKEVEELKEMKKEMKELKEMKKEIEELKERLDYYV